MVSHKTRKNTSANWRRGGKKKEKNSVHYFQGGEGPRGQRKGFGNGILFFGGNREGGWVTKLNIVKQEREALVAGKGKCPPRRKRKWKKERRTGQRDQRTKGRNWPLAPEKRRTRAVDENVTARMEIVKKTWGQKLPSGETVISRRKGGARKKWKSGRRQLINKFGSGKKKPTRGRFDRVKGGGRRGGFAWMQGQVGPRIKNRVKKQGEATN